MITKARKGGKRGALKRSDKNSSVPRRKGRRPLREQLEARRERVRELMGCCDRVIAMTLIGEGYFTEPLSRIATDRVRFEETCRRTISSDRAAIRKAWRNPTKRDPNESREEYIARLQTRINQIDERMARGTTKDTPYAQLQSEIRQIEQAIAKARGVDVMPGDDREGAGGGPLGPTVLVLDLSRCSDAVKRLADDDEE